MVTDFTSKNIPKFFCKICDFKCCKKGDWTRHNLTSKHQEVTNVTNLVTEKTSYHCDKCYKTYYSRNGLWQHNKKCILKNEKNIAPQENTTNKTFETLTHLVLEVVKSNNEMQKQNNELHKNVMEMYKNGHSNTNIQNINSNNNNKTFNLNVFLNEYCKDAMNISDFVESLKIQFSDFENVGKVGFVNGISDIIIKNLKALDIHKRPVHCSDSKREVMYIKDENKWEKENEENNKLRKVIKHIAHKNSKMLPVFKEKYPDCNKSTSKYSDQYNKLIVEALGGQGDNDNEKENKIIKKIAKEVVIDKESNN